MIIGSCKLKFIIPGAFSLKDKRRIIKSLKDKSRNKFNIAVAEVDQNDIWQNATIGIVTLSNNKRSVDQTISKYIDYVEDRFPELQLRDYEREIF